MMTRFISAMAIGLLFCHSSLTSGANAVIDFDRDIRPLLNDHCAGCHGGVKKKGGFSVISRELLLAPTKSDEPAVIPGKAGDSEMIYLLTADDPDERMPPKKPPLTARQIKLLTQWIDSGAPWPKHWAYEPLSDKAAPSTQGNPIDRFVQARLTERGIRPAPMADRRTLIRRLSLDLTGLLPTAREVEAFEKDTSPNAYDALVDRLLASPHFGERWARHWLDEARYADSEGYEKDSPKNDAYRFRDWVINAINADMPFDQFTIKQIAGDLLPDRTEDDLIATKFHLQTQFNLEGGVDSEEDRTKRIIDRVNTVGTVWLATTIVCGQCHDHPYDPVVRRDFYGLYAFFNNADLAADFLKGKPKGAGKLRAERAKKWASLSAILKQQVSNKNLNNKTQATLTGLRKHDNAKGFTRYLEERKTNRRKTYLFRRGDFLQPMTEEGELIPKTPAMLPPMKPRGEAPDRLDLARWLVDGENPLTSRVTVNKVWMHLFGQPISAQANDFGSRGALPSHPGLLTWLSHWFIHDAKWSRKALIKLIVTSKTYQQSSAVRPELLESDPDNTLLARQNRFRVEAEIVRDIALQVSELLSRKVGGPSVFPPLPAIVAKQTYANNFRYRASKGEDRYRRGMYTFFRRTAIDPNLALFDCPDSSASSPMRDRSNNPLQALAVLQNEVFHESAQAFAKQLLASKGSDDARLRRAFDLALGRQPHSVEVQPLLKLLRSARGYYRDQTEQATQLVGPHAASGVSIQENAAWVATVRAVLNLDEFLTRN